MMETILITGGTGLIGKKLSQMLTAKGYKVIILSRSMPGEKINENTDYAVWNIKNETIDEEAFAKADHIIHLAGAGVAEKRWTAKRKQEIVNSRVKSGNLIVKYIREKPNKIKTIISSSAIGWYGPDTNESLKTGFTEDAPAANDFLGQTCYDWENAIQPAKEAGKRLVILRTGIVLSNHGGAFKEFKNPLKFGVAAILSSGKQIISWIHIDDICRMYIQALESSNMKGIYNAIATVPVSNKEMVLALAKKFRNNFIAIHVPSFILKIVLGKMSIEVLKSTTASCNKIKNAGFHFLYPTLDAALTALKKEDEDAKKI